MPEMFAQVILPLPVHDVYTYRVPEQWQSLIKTGQRVVVQFGGKKYYAALVFSISSTSPDIPEIKDILQILDEEPVVLSQNLALWSWMAKYYCCPLGDVFRAALPTGLKLESKSKVILMNGQEEQLLSEKEFLIAEQVKQDVSSLQGLQKRLGKDFSYSAIKSLADKNIIYIEEKIDKRYKPKLETFIKLHPQITNEAELQKRIEMLGRAGKQRALLLHFIDKTGAFQSSDKPVILKKELMKGTGFSHSLLSELVKKNIFNTFQRQVSRLDVKQTKQKELVHLNPFQKLALDEIKALFKKEKVTLMHGRIPAESSRR